MVTTRELKTNSKINNVKKRKSPVHHFDLSFLNQLTENEHSCIEIQTLRHHLALHPFHLNDLNNSIKDILGEGVGKYSIELGGILSGYKDIKLLSELGNISDDSHFIHVDVEADFYIFKPIIGKLLQGVVNKKSKDHVGCLVHKIFNVSLPKPEHQEDWVGSTLSLNSEILFKVTYTNFEGKLPFIRGDIISVISQPVQNEELAFENQVDTKKSKNSKKLYFEDDEEADTKIDTEDVSSTVSNNEVKTKKRKTSKKLHFEDSEELCPMSDTGDLFPKKIKKPKKSKKSKENKEDN